MNTIIAGPSKVVSNKIHTYYCDICKTPVQIECRISHENGKRHQMNLGKIDHRTVNNSTQIQLAERAADCYVQVYGYPRYTHAFDLQSLLSRIGPVNFHKMNSNFAIMKFDRPTDADEAIRRNMFIYGCSLKIRRCNNKDQKSPKRVFVKSKEKEKIVQPKDLDLSGDFHSQADNILSAIRLTREEVEGLSQLYEDLRAALETIWPGCIALPFGSIITGLGIKTSDADCFVNLPPRFRMPGGNCVNKAKKVLSCYPETFTEILTIPNANTPIVKLFHIPTSMNCDVSFKTPLGVRNSNLIGFLLTYDPRLLPLVLLIKYFCKVHNLSGTGRLSNYALTMMVIFYLQRLKEPLLPAIKTLQEDKNFDAFVDCWNTGFSEVRAPNNNTMSLKELFGGFFQFYREFDFERNVICPFYGAQLPKEYFSCLEMLPKEFALYKYNVAEEICSPLRTDRPWCIQDPIEQCHNVGTCISAKMAYELKCFILWVSENYAKKNDSNGDFLRKILLDELIVVNRTEFNVNINLEGVKNLTDDWRTNARETFLLIFEKILHFKMTPKAYNRKESKINVDKKNKDGEEEPEVKQKESFLAEMSYMLWRRRHLGKIYEPMKISFAEKQIKTSEDLLKLNEPSFRIQMACTIQLIMTAKIKKARLYIKWEKGGNDGIYEEFGRFCTVQLPFLFIDIIANNETSSLIHTKSANKTTASSSGTNKHKKNESKKPKLSENKNENHIKEIAPKTANINFGSTNKAAESNPVIVKDSNAININLKPKSRGKVSENIPGTSNENNDDVILVDSSSDCEEVVNTNVKKEGDDNVKAEDIEIKNNNETENAEKSKNDIINQMREDSESASQKDCNDINLKENDAVPCEVGKRMDVDHAIDEFRDKMSVSENEDADSTNI